MSRRMTNTAIARQMSPQGKEIEIVPSKPNAGRWLIFSTLALIFILLTFLANWRFSPDLAEIDAILPIYPYAKNFLGALGDNSILLWLSLKLAPTINPHTFVLFLYIFAFSLKTTTLLLAFGALPTLTFTLLFFFSVDLNQARLSLALSLTLSSWLLAKQDRRILASLPAAFGLLCHYPTAIFLWLFHSIDKINFKAAMALIATVSVLLIIAPIQDSPASRYLLYLSAGNTGGRSYFSLIAALVTAIYWNRLYRPQKLFAALLVAICVATSPLVNLSGRLSELFTMTLLLIAYSQKTATRILRINPTLLSLTISICFFSYRATEWIALGRVPSH